MRTSSTLILLVQILSALRLSDALGTAIPRNYAARRTAEPIKIDGAIYKKVWEEVPWSEDFVEIRGADAPDLGRPTRDTRTRMKMRWDDDYLYIAAEMTAQGWPINADFKKRNEPIFQKDSDIEVFLDADGSNANYKELEVNARNTVWNLLLDKPYGSGGGEHSGRIAKPGEENYWDVKGQKTAVKMYGDFGKDQPEGKWVAEMALRHSDSLDRTYGRKPEAGQFWRIGFSRVEKKGDLNWVWTPQMLWSPLRGRYEGQVNMHAPDAWGYVVFTGTDGLAGPQSDWVDPNWKVKAAAHQLFYAESTAMKPEGGGKLLTLDAMKKKIPPWVNATLFEGLDATVTKNSDGTWVVRVQDDKGCVSTIQQDNVHSFQCRMHVFGMTMPPMRYLMLGISGVAIAGALTAYWVAQQRKKLDAARD